MARKEMLAESSKHRAEESANAYKPQEIKFDLKGENKEEGKPTEMNGEKMSDAELRALWLRRVQTTPGDFLRAKFAYQAASTGQPSWDRRNTIETPADFTSFCSRSSASQGMLLCGHSAGTGSEGADESRNQGRHLGRSEGYGRGRAARAGILLQRRFV